MALTTTAIQKAQPQGKQYKMPDERGMHLLVRPNGSKLWQLRYRHEGKEKTASLGQFPDVSLAEARTRRDELRKSIAAGVDPVAAKRDAVAAQQAAAENNFEAVAREWWAHWKVGGSARHADYTIRRLEQNVFPAFGSKPITDVTAPDIVAMARTVVARDAVDMAKRCMQMSGQVFRYAIAHGKATRNPVTDIRPGDILPATKKKNFARVATKDLPELLRAIEGYAGAPTTRLAIKLLALTFVRTGELIGARWSEFDMKAKRWDIPAERMKARKPHIVPLSAQALEVLSVLYGISGQKELLFPGERDHDKPMSNNTILGALKRMGYQGQMTGHGFRGIASTILHEQGYDHAHIELQLAHSPRDAVSAAYNHALYLPQRAKLMQDWANFLDASRIGNVRPFKRKTA